MAPIINCPACGEPIKPPRASYSRYINLFICADCGVKEAMDGDFWAAKRAATPPTPQPEGYDPWNK